MIEVAVNPGAGIGKGRESAGNVPGPGRFPPAASDTPENHSKSPAPFDLP